MARQEVVTVTPELAHEWLARPFVMQRRVGRRTVREYARIMREGRWLPDSLNPIGFTPDGSLINGQHRLRAVIDADIAVDMLVQYDVDPAAFPAIDAGLRRQVGQFVAWRNPFNVASVARLVMWYDQRRLADAAAVTGPSGYAVTFSNDEVFEFLAEHGSEIEKLVAAADTAYTSSRLPLSVHAAILFIAQRDGADQQRLADWLQGVQWGEGLSRTDPRYVTRQAFIKRAMNRSRNSNVPATWTFIVKGLNAWLAGREITNLRYKAGEDVPSVVVPKRPRRTHAEETAEPSMAASAE